MPYKIVMRKMRTEKSDIHYIHAENTRDAKRKSLKFQCGILYRKIDYIPLTELEVHEECGIYEDSYGNTESTGRARLRSNGLVCWKFVRE